MTEPGDLPPPVPLHLSSTGIEMSNHHLQWQKILHSG